METMYGFLNIFLFLQNLLKKVPNYSWSELILSFDEIKIS